MRRVRSVAVGVVYSAFNVLTMPKKLNLRLSQPDRGHPELAHPDNSRRCGLERRALSNHEMKGRENSRRIECTSGVTWL